MLDNHPYQQVPLPWFARTSTASILKGGPGYAYYAGLVCHEAAKRACHPSPRRGSGAFE